MWRIINCLANSTSWGNAGIDKVGIPNAANSNNVFPPLLTTTSELENSFQIFLGFWINFNFLFLFNFLRLEIFNKEDIFPKHEDELISAIRNYVKNGEKVLVIGAGGVSPSVILSLQKSSVQEISITNRTSEKCIFLKNKFKNLEGYDISKNAISLAKKYSGEKKYNIKFDLLADEKKEAIKGYKTWGKKKFMGREYMGINRTTFIIDENGDISDIIEKVKTKDHTSQIII